MAHLVLVDDNRTDLSAIAEMLGAEGHKVSSFTEPEKALRAIQRRTPDLALVDLRMPRMDGFELMHRIHEMADLPVILLSDEATDLDEAMGLRLGAEDFLHKPCSSRVLVERVRVCLRRKAAVEAPATETETLECGALKMDRICHTVTWNGQEVYLTVTEFSVLWIIAGRPNAVFSRARVLDAAYGDTVYVTDRCIDSQIKRIRVKLRRVDPEFDAIETLYGLGYRFVLKTGADAKKAA